MVVTMHFRSGTEIDKVFIKLQVLEFDSTRKRMSVIVRDPDSRVILVTKGAESSVLPRCAEGPKEQTNGHIDEYAVVGLRQEINNQQSWALSVFSYFFNNKK